MSGGWAWPLNSRKAHWFGSDGRALCGKWLYLGADREDNKHESPDNCIACKRKRAAMEEKDGKAVEAPVTSAAA